MSAGSAIIPLSSPVLSDHLDIYLSGYGFALFVMRDSASQKTCRNVQAHTGTCTFPNNFHEQVIRFESGFLVTISQKYVLQMYENVARVKKPQ